MENNRAENSHQPTRRRERKQHARFASYIFLGQARAVSTSLYGQGTMEAMMEAGTMEEAGSMEAEASGTESAEAAGMKGAHAAAVEAAEASVKPAETPAVKECRAGRSARQSRGGRQQARRPPATSDLGIETRIDPILTPSAPQPAELRVDCKHSALRNYSTAQPLGGRKSGGSIPRTLSGSPLPSPGMGTHPHEPCRSELFASSRWGTPITASLTDVSAVQVIRATRLRPPLIRGSRGT